MKLVLLVCIIFLAGCARPDIQPYKWQGQEDAIRTLSARAASICAVQAAASITLTPPSGDSVNLDAAIIVRKEPNDSISLRLRTWKLSHSAFDVTIRPDGVWLETSDQAVKHGGEGMAKFKPDQVAKAWSLFMGGFFSDPAATFRDTPGPTFFINRSDADITIRCEIDRETLTPLSYRVIDASGNEVQSITLSYYREVGPDHTPWPMRIAASGKDGHIEIRMEDVDLNPDLDESVFTPPRRAVKQP